MAKKKAKKKSHGERAAQPGEPKGGRKPVAFSMKLDDQICFSLYLASKTMTQAYQPVLRSYDLTYPQYLTLLALWEKDRISVKELGERLHLDSGTLSPLLKKLEGRAYVVRTRDPEDERSVLVELTEEGHELKGLLEPEIEKMACSLPVSPAEFKNLRDAANAFSRMLLQNLETFDD